jgi:hypothetical protein
METKLKELWESLTSQLSQFLNQQPWAQELRGKWEELDAQTKLYGKLGGLATGVLLIVIFLIHLTWKVHQLRDDVNQKKALLAYLQKASQDLSRFKESIPPSSNRYTSGNPSTGGNLSWSAYFESLAGSANLEKSALSIGAEKPGSSSEQAKEVLYEVDLKHVSIKQVIQYALSVENGPRLVKTRGLSIRTQLDPAGYLDATLSLSGFTLLGANR